MGRMKTIIPADLAESVADMVIAGKTQKQIADVIGIAPHLFPVAAARNPEVLAALKGARSIRAEGLVQEILEAIMQPIATITTARGEIPNMAEVQRLRLVVETKKWIAARLDRQAWGDHVKVEAEVAHTVSPLEQLRQAGASTEPVPFVDVDTVPLPGSHGGEGAELDQGVEGDGLDVDDML